MLKRTGISGACALIAIATFVAWSNYRDYKQHEKLEHYVVVLQNELKGDKRFQNIYATPGDGKVNISLPHEWYFRGSGPTKNQHQLELFIKATKPPVPVVYDVRREILPNADLCSMEEEINKLRKPK